MPAPPEKEMTQMAIAKTELSKTPPWAQETGRQIELLGFEWFFIEDCKLADMAKVIQIRDDEDLAPKHKVKDYAEAMRNGDILPPAIFTTDYWLVDGATRETAAQSIGRTSYPAFVLKNAVYGDSPPPDLRQKLVSLGGSRNIIHGENLKIKNRARIIEWIAEDKGDNPSAEDIARQLHVPKTQVRDVLTVRDARTTAARLKIDLSHRKLSWTHMIRLGTAAHRLNDLVFAVFAKLVLTTSISTTEMQVIMNRLFACTEDEERMSILTKEAKTRALQGTGLNHRPPVPAQLRQRLGWVEKNGTDNPSVLVETSSLEAGRDQYELIQRNIGILRKAALEQVQWLERTLRAEAEVEAAAERERVV